MATTTTTKNGSSEKAASRKKTGANPVSRRIRKHGYQGYPLSKSAGGVHVGRGFSGVEPLGGGEITLPRAGILTEESTRRSPEEPENQPAKR